MLLHERTASKFRLHETAARQRYTGVYGDEQHALGWFFSTRRLSRNSAEPARKTVKVRAISLQHSKRSSAGLCSTPRKPGGSCGGNGCWHQRACGRQRGCAKKIQQYERAMGPHGAREYAAVEQVSKCCRCRLLPSHMNVFCGCNRPLER